MKVNFQIGIMTYPETGVQAAVIIKLGTTTDRLLLWPDEAIQIANVIIQKANDIKERKL